MHCIYTSLYINVYIYIYLYIHIHLDVCLYFYIFIFKLLYVGNVYPYRDRPRETSKKSGLVLSIQVGTLCFFFFGRRFFWEEKRKGGQQGPSIGGDLIIFLFLSLQNGERFPFFDEHIFQMG